MRTRRLFFLAIVVLALILRFYKLSIVPPSLNWDEAAIGYNAYSLIKTGGFDEYGDFLPLAFRSFDDYKPPLYIYLTTVPVYLFGLNDFAVRFTSVIMGVMAVIFTYLLTFELFKNQKIALLSMFFLSVSPWHLQSSRVAFEAGLSVFLLSAGLWAFLKGLRENCRWLLISAIIFGLNFYAYHSLRVFSPLLSLILIFLYRKELLIKWKYTLIATLIVFIILIPFISIATSISGLMRFKGTSIFFLPEPLEESTNRIDEDKKINQEILGNIFHNRSIVYLKVIMENYLSHFKPEFLFFDADVPTHHAPDIGLLYLWDLPFILLGVYYLFKKDYGRPTIILASWFLFGPIASSFTWGVPNSLRTEVILPTYQIFTALGIYFTYLTLKSISKIFVKLLRAVICLLFLFNFSYYLHQYYVHLNRDFAKDWNYGRKEAVEYVSQLADSYQKIIVSPNLDQAYMHFLYYLKYDPNKYLAEGGTVSGGFREQRNKIGKYEFREFDYKMEKEKGNYLFIGYPNEFPPNANILKTIYYLDNTEAIKIAGS